MESVSARCQVDVLRLTSFRCPAFDCLAFGFLALVDLDFSTCNLSTAEVDLTEGYLTWKIIVLIGYSQCCSIGRNGVRFTLSVLLTNIGHFHCSVMFDLEGDVRYFEIAGWCGFLMEGISTWCQVDVLRLTCFGCPAFNCISFGFIALVDLNLSTSDFCTTEVDLTESNGFKTIVLFIGYSKNQAICFNRICCSFSINCNGTIRMNCELNIFYSYKSSRSKAFFQRIGPWS